jgi:hypothetical protein
MTVESDIISLWGNLFPVSGYKAGLPQSRGKLFHPTAANLHQAKTDITQLEDRLGEITDTKLRLVASKLLRCFRAQFEFSLPPHALKTCADGIFTILLKGEQRGSFVAGYLAEVSYLLEEEIKRWRGYDTSAELRILSKNSISYLHEILTILQGENPDVSEACVAIHDLLAEYERLFETPGLDSRDFEKVYPWLRRVASAAQPTPNYRRLLQDLYDYPETAEELRQQALEWLEVEMPLVRELSIRLAHAYGLPDEVMVEQVLDVMDERNHVGPDVLAEARDMMTVANRYTAAHILKIGPEDQIEMKRTPPYIEPLITEGELLSLDYLTPAPRYLCYLTPSKNESRLTMLNVLVHEYGHGFHASLTSRLASTVLLKISTPLKTPIAEAIAFHREWEFWEDAAVLMDRNDLSLEEQDYLALFGPDRDRQRQTIYAFELETRRWRIARFLRVLGDVEVNLGLRNHIDFVEWAHDKTGLSKKFIHNATFSFLARPGYAPTYAIAGMHLGDLQRSAMLKGISRQAFNTEVSSMGYWPRTLYEQILSPENTKQ